MPKRPDQTQKVTLKVAGVRVPYGCAVYTPPGVLHADSVRVVTHLLVPLAFPVTRLFGA